jgi:hypothetical protein
MSTSHRSRSLAANDPFGDELSGAAGVGDARGVEPGAHEEPPELRRLAEDEIAVEGEALRAVEQHFHFHRFQARRTVDRVLHQDLEVVPVLGQ